MTRTVESDMADMSSGSSHRVLFHNTMSLAKKYDLLKLNVRIFHVCLIGLGLSCYAYMVELKKEQDDSYTAMCDISESISCTKVFNSGYGKGFGLLPKYFILNVPNSIYGIIFYALFTVLGMFNNYNCTLGITILGVLSDVCSIYLAYILYMFKIACIVCISTYIVNIVLTILAIKKLRKLTASNVYEKKVG